MLLLTLLTATTAWAQTWIEVDTKEALNAAIEDDEPLIRLTGDIVLSEYLSIGYDRNQNLSIDQSVTLDLNGHTLSRSLTAADRNGHVIEVHSKGDLMIIDSSSDKSGTITGGWAINGGGICNYGTLTIQGGKITGCKASEQGGGIYNIENGTLNISGGTISSNTASVDGGGIVNRGTASINDASIQDNTATANGGGVWNCGTMTLGHAVTIGGNSALNGGGLFLTGESNATLSGTTIRDNTSTVGGGILMDQSTVTSLTDCTITGNNATEYGGGGIVNYGDLTLNGSTITGNSCAGQGGGLWSNGTVNMQGNITIQNNATLSGLASNVFLKTGCVITVTGDLGSSLIGITLENNNGNATSGYASHNSTTNHFTNDRSAITDLNLVSGEAKVTLKTGGIHYVQRVWDNVNKRVTETLVFRGNDTSTQLTSTNSQNSTTLQGENWYYVTANNIKYFDIAVAAGANPKLILCDGAKLTSEIQLGNGSTLSIYGQIEETGKLVANGNSCHAGIGILDDNNATLNIYGGTVNAQGGLSAAGIGGEECSNGISLNIYGGSVTASGATNAAGIGSGYNGKLYHPHGGNITIYGGYVETHGGPQGAGIGGGDGGDGGTITIHGGTVYAYGGNDAAGIGSGQEEVIGGVHGGTITITGGYVYAEGNDVAAGIGAGEDADMGNITITGGIVEAHGGGGEDWANAINTDDDNEGVNSITLGDNMMVTSERDFTYTERIDAVKGRKDVIIKPCTHNGAIYTMSNATTHSLSCSYCKTTSQPHTFGSYGECDACHLVSLADNASNTDVISHWENTEKSFVLTGRKLWKDNSWNTLCLPFAVDNFNGTPLEGATVKTLETTSFSDGTLTLNFSENGLTAIEAGMPYIVKWETTADPIENPVFKSVTITSTTPADVESEAANFCGIYSPVSIGSEGDNTMLYMGADNKVYYPNAAMTINAFRAYFTLNGITAGDPAAGVRSFVLNFGDDETTGIKPTSNSSLNGAEWYDLSGRRLSGKPTQKGIYVINGNKIVIK